MVGKLAKNKSLEKLYNIIAKHFKWIQIILKQFSIEGLLMIG